MKQFACPDCDGYGVHQISACCDAQTQKQLDRVACMECGESCHHKTCDTCGGGGTVDVVTHEKFKPYVESNTDDR